MISTHMMAWSVDLASPNLRLRVRFQGFSSADVVNAMSMRVVCVKIWCQTLQVPAMSESLQGRVSKKFNWVYEGGGHHR